jgi:predicted RNase H-like nuclease (RuvC/YqgF family)
LIASAFGISVFLHRVLFRRAAFLARAPRSLALCDRGRCRSRLLAVLQSEIDSHRDLIALYRDELIEKERSENARREYAVTSRRVEFERLAAQDTAESRERAAARVEQLHDIVSRYKEKTADLKNAQYSMRRGGPNWDAAQRRIDALERQIAAARAETTTLESSGTSTN